MNRVYPPARGATGRLLKDLAENLARDGWQVSVITTGSTSGRQDINGVNVICVKGDERIDGSLSYMWVWLKMFMAAMRTPKHDVLVSKSDPPLVIVAGQIISKFKKSRHINWCQDLYPNVMPALGKELPKPIMRLLTSWRTKAMKKCDIIIVVGRCMAGHLRREGINAGKIKLISNWADLELVEGKASNMTDKDSKSAIQKNVSRPFEKQIKKENRRFRVLYAGNIGLAHPVDTILDAAIELKKQESDIEFVFIGGGVKFDYIAEQRAINGLDNVRLLPFQPASNLHDIMESGDVHLISMSDEAAGFIVPSKLYSALSVARPTVFIGSETSETARVIDEFNAGFIVVQGDPSNLVRAIKYLRDDSDSWFDAHNGAIKAQEIYNPQASMAEWASCIKKVRCQ